MSKSGISMYDDFEKVKANHVPLGHKLMRDANVLPQQLIN